MPPPLPVPLPFALRLPFLATAHLHHSGSDHQSAVANSLSRPRRHSSAAGGLLDLGPVDVTVDEVLGGTHEERVQGHVAPADAGEQLLAHPWLPELADVRGDLDRGLVGRQRLEVAHQVVPEPHDGRDVAAQRPGHRGSTAASAHCARAASVTTSTCTAVTLYSGQFVAQSEFSVVTTLAPVTGWWKVV